MNMNLPLLSTSTVDVVFSPGFGVEDSLISPNEISSSFLIELEILIASLKYGLIDSFSDYVYLIQILKR